MKFFLLGQLFGAGLAVCQMRFDRLPFVFTDFVANIKNQKRRNIFAVHFLFEGAHRKPPNSLRSLRVARNKEFFTVSSVVPSASPRSEERRVGKEASFSRRG